MSQRADNQDGDGRLRLPPGLLLIPLAFVLGCNEIADYDFWWHLRTGQLIPERGVPETDWYSFTEPDRPWIDVHWGFQWAVAKIHAAFGLAGVVVAKGIVATATMAVVLTAYRKEWSRVTQFWVLLPALGLMSSRFYERPEMLTLLFTSIYLSVLLNAERRPGLLWLLPAVQLAWSNVQGLFAFGPILLAMFWAQVVLNWNRFGRGKWTLLAVTALVAVACVASPYGLHNAVFVRELWEKMDPEEGEFYRSTIGELQDVRSYLSEGGWTSGFVWLQFGLMGLATIGVVLRWREILLRRELFRLLPVVAFSWLGLAALRNGSHFALVVGTMTAWNFGPSFPCGTTTKTTSWQPMVKGMLRWGAPALACAFVAVYFVGGRWSEWMGGHRRFGFGLHPEQFSFTGMDVCAAPGMPDRAAVFHLGHAGPFLYACGPRQKVFMDPRLEVHTRQMFADYLELNRQLEQGSGVALLDALDIPLVVASSSLRSGVQATLLASPRWKCVHWDDVVGVFVRSDVRLPEGVADVVFRHRLWSADIGPLEWGVRPKREAGEWLPFAPRAGTSSRAADNLVRLARGLQMQVDPPNDKLRSVLWCAARFAAVDFEEDYAPRAWRSYGLALAALAEIESAGRERNPLFDPYVEGLRAVGMGVLRSIVAEMADQTAVAYFYQSQLALHGAVDRSVKILERLQSQPKWNASARRQLEGMDAMLAERRRAIESEAASLAAAPTTWEEFLAYRDGGKLGALIDLMKGDPERIQALPLEQKIELARWGLAIGEVVVPPDQWEPNEVENSADAVIVAELSKCVTDGSMAWNWESLDGRQPVGCHLLDAARSVLRGDKAGLEAALQLAARSAVSESQRRHVHHLLELGQP